MPQFGALHPVKILHTINLFYEAIDSVRTTSKGGIIGQFGRTTVCRTEDPEARDTSPIRNHIAVARCAGAVEFGSAGEEDRVLKVQSQGAIASSYAERIIGVLVAMAEGPEISSIKELSERLGFAPSSVHRVLAPLVAAGMVERAPQRRYRIGTELFRIAARVEERFQLAIVAKPVLEQLARNSGESCLLGILNPSQKSLIVAHAVERRLSVKDLDERLANVSPVRSALGRAIMAGLDHNDVRAIASQTGDPGIDLTVLRQHLSVIQRRGLAVSRRVCSGSYVFELAAPFFDGAGMVRGSIGLVVPKAQLRKRVRVLGRLLSEHAVLLSRRLGGELEIAAGREPARRGDGYRSAAI